MLSLLPDLGEYNLYMVEAVEKEIAYIFGYGSLISSQSRKETGITGKTFPCTYKGLRRSWSMGIDQFKAIALNISEEKDSACNGVLVEIALSELPKFDQREIGYKRIQLDPKSLMVEDVPLIELLKTRPVYAYVMNEQRTIPDDYKIQQSYVDVIITGCLEYGEDFTQNFVKTTSGWDQPWLMDRESPTYPRPLKGGYDIKLIDRLLACL